LVPLAQNHDDNPLLCLIKYRPSGGPVTGAVALTRANIEHAPPQEHTWRLFLHGEITESLACLAGGQGWCSETGTFVFKRTSQGHEHECLD
jgi:hypothetical protein